MANDNVNRRNASKGLPAAAWFYSQSFHADRSSEVTAPVAVAPTEVIAAAVELPRSAPVEPQRAFAAATGLVVPNEHGVRTVPARTFDPLAARYEVKPCPLCKGNPDAAPDCEGCDGHGVRVIETRDFYCALPGNDPQPRGELPKSVADVGECVRDWAQLLARLGGPLDAATVRELRDMLVLQAHSLQLQADAYEALAERHAAELAALHDHTLQLEDDNQELRSENGALRVEVEGARASVTEAVDVLLDVSAAAALSAALSAARKAVGGPS